MNTNKKFQYRKPRVLALVTLLIGVVLFMGGAQLASLGGSLYYLLAGISLIISGVLLFTGNRFGSYLYGIFFLVTIAWSFYESGVDAWALLPRIALFTGLGVWLLMPWVRRGLHQVPSEELPSLFKSKFGIIGAVAGIAAIVFIFIAQPSPHKSLPTALGNGSTNNPDKNWAHYGATQAGTRFAPHDQINTKNVDQLKVAWTHRTGVPSTFKGTPIQIDDTLFICTAKNIILAIDADTGKRRWTFDPKIKSSNIGFTNTCRGVTYFKSPTFTKQKILEEGSEENSVSQICPERILTATTDARMIAVDLKTGERCSDFGENGEISLLPGMGEVIPGFYYVTSPPTIAKNVAVLGGWVLDNDQTEEPSGVVRGFDPITGELIWAWDLGREDRSTLPPEGETYTRGTPNAWSLFSADDELGLVYIPTGNATPDYFGGHRTEAAEKYASSVIALNADDGSVRWHYQTTHHDIWDYDVPSQPVLTNIPVNGKSRKAVIVPTKRGELFLFDRETGEPLADIKEIETPQTDVPEEWSSPTQPFSVGMPSFAGDPLKESHMWGITPIDQMLCRIQFKKLRYEGPLTPPTLTGSLQYPGFAGGMNWGSIAVDENNHLMVVNSLHIANHVKLIPREDYKDRSQLGMGGGRQIGTPYAAFTTPFLSPIFTPCQQPPYGELAVVDLASRKVVWQRPHGTSNEQGPLGIKTFLRLPMGMFYSAGTAVTEGGLIFMGSTMDKTMRAIDLLTGEELWSHVLPNTGQATPMSYVSPKTGKQYVVITVPESIKDEINIDHNAEIKEKKLSADEQGGYIIAYALNEK